MVDKEEFELIKAEAKKTYQHMLSDPNFPNQLIKPVHRKSDLPEILCKLAEVKSNPSQKNLNKFLATYFQIPLNKSFIKKLENGVYSFRSADHIDLLIEALFRCHDFGDFPAYVNQILWHLVPIESFQEMTDFIEDHFPEFPLAIQAKFVSWMCCEFLSQGLDIGLSSRPKETSFRGLFTYVSSFLETTGKLKIPHSNYITDLQLNIKPVAGGSDEITGELKISFESPANGKPCDVSTRLDPTSTYVLGFLFTLESSNELNTPNRPRFNIDVVDKWAAHVGVLPGKAKFKARLDKAIARLHKEKIMPAISEKSPNPILKYSDQLKIIKISKHVQGPDYIWLTSQQKPGGKNLHWVLNKKPKTRHKKPRQR